MLVVIPFGEPHKDEKMRILRSNLSTIRGGYPGTWTRVVIRLYAYDDVELPDDVSAQVEVIRTPGIVGDFFREHVTPAVLEREGHDFLLMMLDDVEILTQPDWKRLLLIKELSGAHLVSPTLSHNSTNIQYPYMKHVVNAPYTSRIVSVMEMFCFLFDARSYSERYYPLLDHENPWMWGIDLCLYYETGVLPGQVNQWVARHHYQGESYKGCGRNPEEDMKAYLAKRGHSVHSLWEQRVVVSVLNMQHLTDKQWRDLWRLRFEQHAADPVESLVDFAGRGVVTE